jgi:hypothetical protein
VLGKVLPLGEWKGLKRNMRASSLTGSH